MINSESEISLVLISFSEKKITNCFLRYLLVWNIAYGVTKLIRFGLILRTGLLQEIEKYVFIALGSNPKRFFSLFCQCFWTDWGKILPIFESWLLRTNVTVRNNFHWTDWKKLALDIFLILYSQHLWPMTCYLV